MLTFFTTAKPFLGHAAIIQRNALKSWTLVHPDVEVILFGDDYGAAEVARDLKIRHEPHVERSECGTKRLDYLFRTAQAITRHDALCYVNCDIVLMEDFRRALRRVWDSHYKYLMVGRRWDLEVWDALDFSQANWRSRLQAAALSRGRQRPAEWIDYFAFNRGLYGSSVPPFVVGRIHWDNWLLWKARQLGADVVDASESVMAVHQNHDYRYHPQGREGMWRDAESQRNLALAGGYRHLRNIDSAGLRLANGRLAHNPFRGIAAARWTVRRLAATYADRVTAGVQSYCWHPILRATRPLRSALGLRSAQLRRDPRGGMQ